MSVSNRQMFEAVKMVLVVASEKTGGEIPSKFEAVCLEVIAAFYDLIGAPLIEESYFSYKIGRSVYEIKKRNAEKLLSDPECVSRFPPVFYSALSFFCFCSLEAASRWWYFDTYGRISWTINMSPGMDFEFDDETKEYCRRFGEIMQKYVKRDLDALYGRPVI